MAPEAKANIVFHGMKELPGFEEAGGEYLTNSEVYHMGRQFRKVTDASKPTSEIDSEPEEGADKLPRPPRWSSKKKKRKRAIELPSGIRTRNPQPSKVEPLQPGHVQNEHIRSQPENETVETRRRLYEDVPVESLFSRVQEILSRLTGARGTAVAPIDLDIPAEADPVPQAADWLEDQREASYTWQRAASRVELNRPSMARADVTLPTWMTSNGPALVPLGAAVHAQRPREREVPVSIGDLLQSTAPKDVSGQSVAPARNEIVAEPLSSAQSMPREGATLRELLSMQQTAIQDGGQKPFPPNPFL